MSSLNRMLLRDLRSMKFLLLAVMSIITVGVMCYVTMQSAYRNLKSAQERYYADCRMADFWIDLRKAPRENVQRLASLPGLAALQSRISFLATVDLPEFAPPVTVQVISLPYRNRGEVNDILLREGQWFSSELSGEVIVSESFALAHRLKPGSSLRLILNNRQRDLRVAGTAQSSEFTYMIGPGAIMPDPQRFGVCYVPERFAEEASGYRGAANQLVGRFSPGTRAQQQATLRRLEDELEPYGRESTTELKLQMSNQYLMSELDGLGAFASVVPTMFLVVAALVLNVLVTRLVRQQRTVIGTLKAIGYSNARLSLHFLMFGAVVGIGGGLFGSALGQLAASGMMVIYRQYFEIPDLRSQFHWPLHLTGLLASLACAALGSLRSVLAVLRLEPATAMRPEPPHQGRRVLLERIVWLWRRLSAPWRLAVRSLVRHRSRTGAGVFAAAMGAGLLVTGFMMLQAQTHLLNFEFYNVVRSDIDLAFDDVVTRDALYELQQLPGVLLAEPRLSLPCRVRHGPYQRRIGIAGLEPGAQLTVPQEGGAAVRIPHDGLVIGRRMADNLHVDVGDYVAVTPIRARQQPRRVRVSRVSDGFLGTNVYADIRLLSRLTDESWVMNGAQLKLDGSPQRLEQLYQKLKRTPAVRSVTSRRDMIRSLEETILASQGAFIGILVVFSGAIFFGSIVNASLVSLAERQREVATMRALGYGPWRVGNLFLRESLVINITGTLLGLPFGYFLLMLTARLYNSDLIRLPVVSAPWIPAATAALGLLFTFAAQAVVQRVIHRSDWLEALKTKE